jgi:SAM-dependent methyltransferase
VRSSVERLMDIYYPIRSDGVRRHDATVPFYEWILAQVDRESIVLNVGAGPTPPEPQRHLHGRVGRLVGVDPDPIVLTNSDLDEAFVNDGVTLPFDDCVFDAVISDWTLEHVAVPAPFLSEIYRVLKPGGFFWFRTPSRWHYVSLVASVTPHWFHSAIANRSRALSDEAHEPWPTRYRLNGRHRLFELLTTTGFRGVVIRQVESYPSYLMFHPAAFRVGVGYERLVNRFAVLAPLRHTMTGRAQRPNATAADALARRTSAPGPLGERRVAS